MDLALRGGIVVDPDRGCEEQADVWVREGEVAGIGPQPGPGDWELIDVPGLVVCPGLVDIHTHLREPGGEHKETIASGTAAALAGGFTTVCAMPNTTPAVDRPERVADLRRRIAATARCRVLVIGAATLDNAGEQHADRAALAAAGCVAITDDAFPLQSVTMMAEALCRSADAGLPFIAHCEDTGYTAGGVMHEGCASRSLGLPGQSSASEQYSLRDWHEAAAMAGAADRARLHVAHVSSHAMLRGLEQARTHGTHLRHITLETAPHYLALTEDAVAVFGADAKMNPPLRTEVDRQAIRAALTSGVITVIATDHAPHAPEEKARGMLEAPFGVVGLETALGVTLTELCHGGEMSLPSALALMTRNAADALGLTDERGRPLGRLAPGMTADLTIIDPLKTWTVDPEEFHSLGRNTPFAGRALKGRAWGTVVGGEVRMREYELQGP